GRVDLAHPPAGGTQPGGEGGGGDGRAGQEHVAVARRPGCDEGGRARLAAGEEADAHAEVAQGRRGRRTDGRDAACPHERGEVRAEVRRALGEDVDRRRYREGEPRVRAAPERVELGIEFGGV